jgi:hypothetical protein
LTTLLLLAMVLFSLPLILTSYESALRTKIGRETGNPVDVPEPASVLGLLAVGAIAAGTTLKKAPNSLIEDLAVEQLVFTDNLKSRSLWSGFLILGSEILANTYFE